MSTGAEDVIVTLGVPRMSEMTSAPPTSPIKKVVACVHDGPASAIINDLATIPLTPAMRPDRISSSPAADPISKPPITGSAIVWTIIVRSQQIQGNLQVARTIRVRLG